MEANEKIKRMIRLAKKVLARRQANAAIEKAKQSAQLSPLTSKPKPS